MSLGIIGIVAAMAIGATSSFFSDTETSSGNVFAAGAIDLKVDNESYYNGEAFPGTTFGPSDLEEGILIINFRDLKPDDEGEDTISLHVNDNDAWLCMDMSLTSNDDLSSNEPELKAPDAQDVPGDAWDGELAGLVQMAWWIDDGDNVLEEGETLLSNGAQTITNFFGEDKTFTADLADSTTNVWTGVPGPAKGSETYYIGKGWCFGTMTLAPVVQDGQGKTGSNGPTSGRGTGFSCDGAQLGNESQTDGATMDIAFRAVQARHNPDYTCGNEQPRLSTITVTKEVVNDNGGQNVVGDFALFIDNGGGPIPVTSGAAVQVAPGSYTVSETGLAGYASSFMGPDCDATGQIVLGVGENKACTIKNDDILDTHAKLTVTKIVFGGTKQISDFPLFVDSTSVASGVENVFSAGSYTVSETSQADYTGVISGDCAANGSITLSAGGVNSCTITNTFINQCFGKADVMLVLDRSGSIDTTELAQLKTAAKAFVSTLAPSADGIHIGMVSFSDTATLNAHLTGDASAINSAIDSLVAGGFTNLQHGIKLAGIELQNPGDGHDRTDSDSKDVIVIITDGEPNRCFDTALPSCDLANSQAAAEIQADTAKAAGSEIYGVGVGITASNATFLQSDIVSPPPSTHYYDTANYAGLETILENLATCAQ